MSGWDTVMVLGEMLEGPRGGSFPIPLDKDKDFVLWESTFHEMSEVLIPKST